MSVTSTLSLPNKPAAGKAGLAPWLAIGHHWSGLPEPGRWAETLTQMHV